MAPARKNQISKTTKESLLDSNAVPVVAMNFSNGVGHKQTKSPVVKRGRPAQIKNETFDKIETSAVHVPANKPAAKKGRGKAEKTKVHTVAHVEKESSATKRGRPATKKPEAASNQNGVHEEPIKVHMEEVATKSSEKKDLGEKRAKGKQKKPMSSKGGSPNKKAKLEEKDKTDSLVKKTSQLVDAVTNGSNQHDRGDTQQAVNQPAKRGRKPKVAANASNGIAVEKKKEPSKEQPPAEQKEQPKSKKPKRDAKSIIQGSLDLSIDGSSESEDQKKVSGVLKPTTRTTTDGRRFTLKLSTFNVSGLRSWFDKGGQKFLIDDERPDILFIQETKISSDKDITDEMRRIPGYHSYFKHSAKKGYAGVALYSKIMPMSVTYGLNEAEHDEEARLITAEYEKFYLVGAYVPNSGRGLVRLDYRQKWNEDFLSYLKRLDAKKPVIYCGDLNVAHQEIDLANPKTNRKNAGFTDEERGDFTKLLSSGFVDSFRKLYPKKTAAYTFWTNMRNCREKNIGWRLDYFLISQRLEKDLCDCIIRSEVTGSDHCPVTLFMAL